MSDDKIINLALKAKQNSYSPYSKFPVGVALETKDGKVYLGTNVENASYGATVCAERSAIFSAISNGEDKNNFSKIAIVADNNDFIYPCSLCRQVMSEFFNEDVEVLVVNTNTNEFIRLNIEELVPYKFTEKELKNV